MRNKISTYIIITTLVMALLVSTGKATSVLALADPVWPEELVELKPVYDTDVIALKEYVNAYLDPTVTDGSFGVFSLLLGLYVCSQGGFSEYKLSNPYATQSGVINWLKDCGIQLYNTMIGMGFGVDPITGIDVRPYVKAAAEVAMGCAVKASTYPTVNDFISDVNVQEKYFLPLDFGMQDAFQYIFSKNGGMYEWQFDVSEFVTNLDYHAAFLPPTSNYWTLLSSFPLPHVRCNFDSTPDRYLNVIMTSTFFMSYNNIFLNTTDGYLYFCDDDGNSLNSINFGEWQTRELYYDSVTQSNTVGRPSPALNIHHTYPTLSSYPEIIQYVLDNPNTYFPYGYTFLEDFIDHYYYGSSWNNKTEIFHTTDLNLDPNSLPYYQQITNDYLFDVKGILQDLLNETDLTNVILNNLFDLEGVVVTDPALTHVAIEILEEIQTINVPIPVNLNDVALYTENDYIEEIKYRARKFGEVIGQYIIFWHNSDPATCYILLGGSVVILLAAFIGKWGHS